MAPRPNPRTTRVGLVGGLGPESTIDYYRRILDAWKLTHPGTAPPIVIDSLDVDVALRLVASDRAAMVDYLADSAARLASAGADFIAMTANTPHLFFDEVASRTRVPMLSIVQVCANEARARGLQRLGLLGTRFTMEGGFFRDVFERHGIAVVSPGEADREWLHKAYVDELIRGVFLDETRNRVEDLVERMRIAERIDGIILGGTELPLLLESAEIAGIPALDTTALHVAAIVQQLAG